MAALAAATLVAAGVSAQDAKIVIDGSTTVGPIAKQFAEHFMKEKKGLNITVGESGSGNGAKSLINGTCDIATMSRAMKGEEVEAAKGKGVNAVQHVVAFDGLAIVVHPSNPVQGLTVAQVRDVYLGKVKSWKDLGGPDKPIVLISRDTNSGTYEAFEGLVMKKEKIAEGAEYVGSSGAIRQRVQSTPAAIGYVGLGFVDETVKALVIDGVAPTAETVLSKQYPVSRELYLYTNGDPKAGTALAEFVGFCKTEKGRQIVSDIGFVPVPAK